MRDLTKLEVLELAQEKNVKFIRLQFTDILGALKNIAVTVEELPKALEGRIFFDSSVIDGIFGSRKKEICLLPDPSSFVIFPWRPREGAVARLICDVVNHDGTTYEGCPRNVLKKVAAEAGEMGFRLQVGADAEFFLFQTDEKNYPTLRVHDAAGFCDLSPADLGENARRDMVLTLEEMGIEISSSHHESAPGQHEISLKSCDALQMADNLVTFRFVVRTIARRHGLHASFMPRPINGLNGSGLNIYQALYRDLDNAFFDPAREDSLSETALQYIGGLIRHARSFSCITNPIINSYKRLIPAEFSPCFIAWSKENRNTALRVPMHRENDTGVEMRSPDPAANPYLIIAVMLKAGLDGIRNRIMPPRPVDGDLLTFSADKLARHNVLRFPRSLHEAIGLLPKDKVVLEAIGGYLAERYISAKNFEWSRFENHVHNWEVEEYLTQY